jgi:hypothetical protein
MQNPAVWLVHYHGIFPRIPPQYSTPVYGACAVQL